jgi:hypothetical protein
MQLSFEAQLAILTAVVSLISTLIGMGLEAARIESMNERMRKQELEVKNLEAKLIRRATLEEIEAIKRGVYREGLHDLPLPLLVIGFVVFVTGIASLFLTGTKAKSDITISILGLAVIFPCMAGILFLRIIYTRHKK